MTEKEKKATVTPNPDGLSILIGLVAFISIVVETWLLITGRIELTAVTGGGWLFFALLFAARKVLG